MNQEEEKKEQEEWEEKEEQEQEDDDWQMIFQSIAIVMAFNALVIYASVIVYYMFMYDINIIE